MVYEPKAAEPEVKVPFLVKVSISDLNIRKGPGTNYDRVQFSPPGVYTIVAVSADPDSTFAFAITLDDKVIGSIGVFRKDNIHSRTAEMGYYIGEPYWGNGYMTNAIKQVCEYVLGNTDIIRIFAEPFAHNIASCKALEKAGFQYEGTLKCNAIKCGNIIDMKMYALVRE